MAHSKLSTPVVKIKAIGDLFKRAKNSITVSEEDEIQQSVTCPFCTRKERLLSFDTLKQGSHICLGGEKFKRNVGNRQFAVYTHHAIVEKVEAIGPSTGKLTLIHFISTSFDSANKIQRTIELKDLLYDEIYVVHYRHPVNPPEKVLQRARLLLSDGDQVVYSGLERNCEHLCNLCCAGSDESLQVQKGFQLLLQDILSSVGAIGGKILRVVLRLVMMSVDDISKLAVAEIAVPWGILSGLVVIQLIYCAYQHIQYNKRLKKGTMCYSCCTKMKKDLWLRFGAFCALQVGGLQMLSMVTAAVASKGVLIGVMSVFGVIAVALIWVIPKVRKSLCAPFQGRYIDISSVKDVWPGDVIRVKRGLTSVIGIVSYAKADPANEKRGKIKLIFYSNPSLIGRRTVKEDEERYDLNKVKIEQLDYSNHKCHNAKTVVQRARKRVGEHKYGILSNRSCHFCHWAKVDEDGPDELDSVPDERGEIVYLRSLRMGEPIKFPSMNVDHRESRKHATTTIGKKWARIRDDVKPGQIIGFGTFRNKAVCTYVKFSEEAVSKLSVSVVHYGRNRKVCKETIDFDLNEQDIWIYRYHPLCRFNKEEVVRRAIERVGQGGYNIFTNRSSHLVAEIVEKGLEERLDDFSRIKRGDVIKFYYWTLRHTAVVSKVQSDERKEDLTGKRPAGTITVIHYALDSLFATRTIKEEEIRFNLQEEHVYLNKYDGFVTYPYGTVVQRAQSRVGEQRFSAIKNTSSDFVHWAKVVQTPALVALSQPGSQQEQSSMEQAVLMPLVGKQTYKHFQAVQVHAWRDLKPGSIISFRYYWIWHEGILTEASKHKKQIKVIHYGTRHIFATRKIMEDTLNCDLKYDQIWLYRCNPRLCRKEAEILKCARKRLGEKNWASGNRSWDFCVKCVLKKRRRSTSPELK